MHITRSFHSLIIAVLLRIVTARPSQYTDGINGVDEVPRVETEVVENIDRAISEKTIIIHPSYSRHLDEITNDPELYNLSISSFRLTVNSIIDVNANQVRDAITTTLDNNLLDYFVEFRSSNIDGVEITRVPAGRRLKTRVRQIVQSPSSGKSLIDVEGGVALFYGVLYEQVSGSELDEAILEILGAELKNTEEFKGLSIYSASETGTSLAPSTNKQRLASIAIDSVDVEVTKENGGNGGVIAIGVLSAVAILVAGVLYVKKKHGISLIGLKTYTHRDFNPAQRHMKRDYFFEEYVVECCTDNDMIFSEDPHPPFQQ